MRRPSLLAGLAALATSAAGLVAPAPVAAAEPAVTHEIITSFDGTPIYSTLFLPAGADANDPVPVVLRGHGWSSHGERDLAEASSTTHALLAAGYAVLTWDERGFGYSGDEVRLLKPDFEGRDVSAVIDRIATDPRIAPLVACESGRHPDGSCDDPVIGMTGESYGGGIQLLAGSFDAEFSGTGTQQRIDAIAPEITWHDLRYTLYENSVINLAWSELLYLLGVPTAQAEGLSPANPAGPQAGGLAFQLHQAQLESVVTNQLSAQSVQYLDDSGIASYGQRHPLTVPTLFLQGSVDTLFDLTEAARSFRQVRTQAPAKLVAFCGGHVPCPAGYADAGDREFLDRQILGWFDRYLRGSDTDTGAPVVYRTNAGIWRSADDFPPSDAEPVIAGGRGSVVGSPVPTAALPTTPGALPLITAVPNPPGDPHAFSTEVLRAGAAGAELVGIPTAEVAVTGTGAETHLFLKLVDREAGQVVNLQEAPLRVTGLSPAPQRFHVTMPGIAYTLPAGHHLDLQVSSTSLMHAGARTPAAVTVDVVAQIPKRT